MPDSLAPAYGIYDLANNNGWISVGVADTAEFAVESIRRWWYAMGRDRFPAADRLLVTADAGGSNGYRTRACKFHLTALAAETGTTHHSVPLPAGHLEVEWDRAPHVQLRHDELEGPHALQWDVRRNNFIPRTRFLLIAEPGFH